MRWIIVQSDIAWDRMPLHFDHTLFIFLDQNAAATLAGHSLIHDDDRVHGSRGRCVKVLPGRALPAADPL